MKHDALVQKAMNRVRLSQNNNIRRVREEGGNYFTDNAPVVDIVNNIIEEAIARRASDIHFEPVADGIRCRLRIDGQLERLYDTIPQDLQDFIISRIKIMCDMDIAEHRIPQDGRFPYNGEADIRVSVMPLINGEKVVMRILNDSRKFISLDKLDFLPENKKKFLQLIHSGFGAVIIAGPVNSGKTTTLYATIKELSSGKENIVTIEDPVEYQMEGINQLQVNNKTGLTFAEGLRASLRQDSDLIMLGEIRDEETAGIAIRAALTGHLLVTTLHTPATAEGIFRLLDMGIKGYMIAASVKGIVAQRLVRRLCVNCRKRITIKADSFEGKIWRELLKEDMTGYEARGCELCNNTGFSGRVPIHEVMIMTDALTRELKRENVDFQSLKREIYSENKSGLWQDGLEKVRLGLTDLTELQRVLGIY